MPAIHNQSADRCSLDRAEASQQMMLLDLFWQYALGCMYWQGLGLPSTASVCAPETSGRGQIQRLCADSAQLCAI